MASGAFNALEVRELATAAFFDGTKTTTEGIEIPGIACVASSDAHHHDHIPARKRCAFVRIEKATFGELVAALSFRHRVSLDGPANLHTQILGFHVVGSFIPECWVSLNESLNALIGSKGTGKTGLLECLRFVLNAPVPQERHEEINRHVNHVLGSSGYVECLVRTEPNRHVLITRRADARSRITVMDEFDNVETLSDEDALPVSMSILGWHEIEQVAANPTSRITLLDRVGDPQAIRDYYHDIAGKVEAARDELPALQRDTKRLNSGVNELWELKRKRDTLAKLDKEDLSILQKQYEWYLHSEQVLAGLRAQLTENKDQLPSRVRSRLDFEVEAKSEGVDDDAVRAIATVTASLGDYGADESTAVDKLVAANNTLLGGVDQASREFATAFARFRDTVYAPKVEALSPEDRSILTRQIQVLEETKSLPRVEQHCSDLLGHVNQHATSLAGLCGEVADLRDKIVELRSGWVKALNNDLDGIHLDFRRSANKMAQQQFQGRYGAEGVSLLNYVQQFGGNEPYQNLIALFEHLQSLTLDEASWDVQHLVWDVRMVELLDVIDDDDIDITMEVGKAGFVPIQNLSAGQRCVAAFPLLLRNTKAPLIIDQPEDNLDNRYIADFIAPDLLNRKRDQQFLITSHNANLVVLTDADLILHVDSDGVTCHFAEHGFLACAESTVRDSVVDVLDGGEAALQARQRKYGHQGSSPLLHHIAHF